MIIDEYINLFWATATQAVALIVPIIAIIILMKIVKIFLIGKES